MNKFALIGLGFISPRHIESIKKIGGELTITCDIDEKKKLTDIPFFTSYVEMMNSDLFDQVSHVSICTPNYLHYPMIQMARLKGKIVLCEKPLTLDSNDLIYLDDKVFTVLQLRYHPEIIKLKKELTGKHKIKMIVKVKREQSYWDGWKGREHLSGGILFNLGIHYFDLLIHLFGDKYKVKQKSISDKMAEGIIDFNGTSVNFYLEIKDKDDGQDRILDIDGKELSLSKQDNLSFENLHAEVYKDLLKNKGITPSEAAKSIKLVECLKK